MWAKISLLDEKKSEIWPASFWLISFFGKKLNHSEKLFLVVRLSRYKLLFSTKRFSSIPSLLIFWRCVVSVSVVSGVGDRTGTEN